MSEKFLVFLSDEDSPDRGEIRFFDDAEQGSLHAESLLESGYEQPRIRVFTSTEVEVLVSHRPVVSLVDPDGSEKRDAAEEGEPSENGEGETAGVKDGVRLSSMFNQS